jgi:hypothetical protein
LVMSMSSGGVIAKGLQAPIHCRLLGRYLMRFAVAASSPIAPTKQMALDCPLIKGHLLCLVSRGSCSLFVDASWTARKVGQLAAPGIH